MTNSDFWDSVYAIIEEGYTAEGLSKLEEYARQFISERWVFQRFSSFEQHGCAKGGTSHVIASVIAGAEDKTDYVAKGIIGFKRELQQAAKQAQRIEKWAKSAGIWFSDIDNTLTKFLGSHIAEGGEAKVYDSGSRMIKSIGLDYYLFPIHALDRISLHNTYFPETSLEVIGFGRDENDKFKILVDQPFIEGIKVSEDEITFFMEKMGFTLRNPRNWTYSNQEIYLSDVHDENVLKSRSGTMFIIDCDIRLNTPNLKLGGTREFSTEIDFRENLR